MACPAFLSDRKSGWNFCQTKGADVPEMCTHTKMQIASCDYIHVICQGVLLTLKIPVDINIAHIGNQLR